MLRWYKFTLQINGLNKPQYLSAQMFKKERVHFDFDIRHNRVETVVFELKVADSS